MYCVKCGAKNKDDAAACVICATPLVGVDAAQKAQPMIATETAQVQAAPSVQAHAPATGRTAPLPGQAVSNHLVFAILTTFFCCLPFGVVSIIFAAQVSGKLAQGDIEGAMNSSRLAKIWAWVSFGTGLVLFLFFTVFGIIAAVAENM